MTFDANSFLSEKDSKRLTDSLLGEHTHADLKHLIEQAQGRQTDHLVLNAISSVAASLLHFQHPSGKRYDDWKLRSLDLFRGEPEEGTTITHAGAIGELVLPKDADTLSYVYISLLGKLRGSHFGIPPSEAFPNSSNSGEELIIASGEGLAIVEWPIDHVVHIEPESVAIRMSYI